MKLDLKVIKRDGSIEDFDSIKIKTAIEKTAKSINETFNDDDWSEIKPILKNELEKLSDKEVVNISEIDDIVMETLIYSNFKLIAIAYIKHRKTKVYNKSNDLGLSPVAMKLLESRYLDRDEEGNLTETPREMMLRVAAAVASAEKNTELKLKWKDEFFKIMSNLEFLPGSPCLVAAGSKRKGTWLPCFAFSIPDSLPEMFDVYKIIANTFKMGGGAGISIANVREDGAIIKSTKGKSSGPIKLILPVVDAVTEGIKQGSFRRGALMCLISDNHPDIEQFIDAKVETNVLNNMNMSILITNKFISAAKKNEDWDLISPATGKTIKTVLAKYLLEKIAANIYSTGEPGILFKDRINKDNPTPHLGELSICNPCFGGEEQLLTTFGYRTFSELSGTKPFIINAQGNIVQSKVWKSGVKNTIKLHLSNGEVTVCTPDQVWKTLTGKNVQAKNLTGKRLMPFALGGRKAPKVIKITNGGKQTVYDFTEPKTHWGIVNSVIASNCAEAVLYDREACCLGSINLVRHIIDGKFDWEKFAHSIQVGIRFLDNILDKSSYPDSSIKAAVMRTRKVGLGIMGLADVLIMLNIKYSSPEAIKFVDKLVSFMNKIADQESTKLGKEKGLYEAYKEGSPKRRNSIVTTFAPTGSLSLLAEVSSGIEPNFEKVYTRTFYPENESITIEHPLKDHASFETTYDISPEQHLKILATAQKYIENAISKTINTPEDMTIDGIKKLILQGHELGVKGLTIFRKNCKRKALIKCDGLSCNL